MPFTTAELNTIADALGEDNVIVEDAYFEEDPDDPGIQYAQRMAFIRERITAEIESSPIEKNDKGEELPTVEISKVTIRPICENFADLLDEYTVYLREMARPSDPENGFQIFLDYYDELHAVIKALDIFMSAAEVYNYAYEVGVGNKRERLQPPKEEKRAMDEKAVKKSK